MKRQKIRKLFLIVSLLLFPVTLYYFSPALIFDAGMKGIINGSFIVFAAMFVLSIGSVLIIALSMFCAMPIKKIRNTHKIVLLIRTYSKWKIVLMIAINKDEKEAAI